MISVFQCLFYLNQVDSKYIIKSKQKKNIFFVFIHLQNKQLICLNLVKRDIPSPSSIFHQHQHHQPQTANASTNTSLYDNYNSSITNKSASVELTPLSTLMKIPAASSSSSFFLQSPISSPLLTIGNLNKITKHSSNINQQDSSLFNFVSRSDTKNILLFVH
jgi:hypothetical protein